MSGESKIYMAMACLMLAAAITGFASGKHGEFFALSAIMLFAIARLHEWIDRK